MSSITDLDSEILGKQDTADADFLQTFTPAGFSVGGKELDQFNALRRAACQAMGLRWGFIAPSQVEEITEGDQVVAVSYPGLVQDVTLIAWACAQDEQTILRAIDHPTRYKADVYKFADAAGLIFPSAEFNRVQGWVSAALSAENNARAVPVGDSEPSKKKA